MKDKRIDEGRAFDWGKASGDYAKYRDIYPEAFYQEILNMNLCTKGQSVLDLGTGTGVLPRNLYRFGARFTGTDISENQITEARRLAEEGNMDICFLAQPAEQADFPEGSFDVVTACQCFAYFNYEVLFPVLHRILKPGGRFAVFYMAWLPFEDKIAGESERLVLAYHPQWSGKGETRHPIVLPEAGEKYFTTAETKVFDLEVPFTRESWNGRMRACRGIGASLSEERVREFTEEHGKLLKNIAPESFHVLHYAAMSVFSRRDL